jgi:peptidyl-prolyl cis-trans isomerase C
LLEWQPLLLSPGRPLTVARRHRQRIDKDPFRVEIGAMRSRVQAGLLLMLIVGLTGGIGSVRAQTEQPAGPARSATRVQAGRAPEIPGAGDVLATVSEDTITEKVTKGELISFLSRYPIPANENRDQVYHDAVDSLINTKLLTLFLNRQRIVIPPAKIDEEVARLEEDLKKEKQDLAAALTENNISMKDVRSEMENRIRWSEYVKAKATDPELRRYVATNRDLFSGTQVRASHILLRVEPDAPAGEKEKVKQKLAAIKSQIDTSKLTFAEAANKYSEDPANAGGAGGDLDYFTLNSGFIPEFTDVAFKLKKGTVSEPFETPYGYHLVQVTDRKEGRPVDFDQNKPFILQAYAGELQKNLLIEERKRAKIEIKPMPRDLFPPAAAPVAPGTPKASAPAAKPGQ